MRYDVTRCKAFQCDLTSDPLTDQVPQESVDLVLLIFVLSAVTPGKMPAVVNNIAKVCHTIDSRARVIVMLYYIYGVWAIVN